MKESLSQAPQTPTPGGILVSVLVPVYNSKTSLQKCLNTLAAQDCQNIEFICVNDGSTDSSGDILEQQAAKDARFRVIHQANGGYGKAMNTGLDAAKGSYIGIVEPDDWVESDMFSRLLKLAQESQADIAKANYCIERKNLSRPNKKFDNQEEGSCHAPADLPEYMLGAPSIWTAIYLADWLKENNIRFAETPGASFQDLGFCVRTWLAARKIAITHYAPYHYWEDNPVSSSRKLEDGAWAAFKELSSLGEYFSRIPQRCSSVRNSLVMRIFATMRADYRLRIRQTSKSFLLKYSHLLNDFFPLETLNPAAFTKNEWHDLQLVYQTPLLFPRKSKTRVNFLQRLLSCREEAGYRVIRVLGMTFMMNRKSTAEPSVSKLSDNDLPYDLTVATVCWNALQFLPRCIESVQPLYKSSLSVEHLFIDGASTDGTVEYLQQQLKEGRITRLISEPDKGLYDAMNKAIRNARGKVIVFINADDAICPEGTPACCAPILEGRAEYTAGQALCISSTSGKTSIIYPRIKKALWRQPYCHQSMFCSTKLLRRVGGFASEKFRIGADTELMRRLYINHVPYEAVNKISAHFYTGGVSYSPAVRTEVYDLMMHFTDAYCHEASIHPGSAITTLKHLRRYTTRKLLQQDGCSTLDAAHRERLGTFVSKLAQALPSGSRAMLRLHQRLLIAWYGFNSIFSSSKNRATNQLHKEITELFVSHL